MIRTRDCSNPEPKFGGKSCEGSYEQTVTCTLDPCPGRSSKIILNVQTKFFVLFQVHGGYSEWMNGPCSSTCGPGQLIQTRECSNPIPQFGGRSCEGPTSNVVPCEIVPCPGIISMIHFQGTNIISSNVPPYQFMEDLVNGKVVHAQCHAVKEK